MTWPLDILYRKVCPLTIWRMGFAPFCAPAGSWFVSGFIRSLIRDRVRLNKTNSPDSRFRVDRDEEIISGILKFSRRKKNPEFISGKKN